MPSVAVQLRNITKRYGTQTVVNNLNVEVASGEFLCLLGPSGCGKSTTLRMIAGFIAPDAGQVLVDGVDITNTPPNRRNMGMVYQNYALFPHMTVFENVAFGLKMRRVGRAEVRDRVETAVAAVALSGLGRRYPRELSGGQQQRVALARAIVLEPQVLLLDEPLSNLDEKLRKEMQLELRRLHDRLGMTTIYVTHDQEEALTLSDRVGVMNKGNFDQLGAPRAVYDKPSTLFVAGFLGKTNVMPCVVEGPGQLSGPQGLHLQVDLAGLSPGKKVHLCIRPENLYLGDPGTTCHHPTVNGVVEHVVYAGAITEYVVQTSEGVSLLVAETSRQSTEQRRAGDHVIVMMPPEHIHPIVEPGQ